MKNVIIFYVVSKTLIHQPEYLPWINLFIKMNLVEKFVILDNVQYSRRSFQNRNLLPNIKKNCKDYITIPIQKAAFTCKINKIKIDYTQNWIEKHLEKIKTNYSKSKFFEEVFELIRKQLNLKEEYLCNLNENFLKLISLKSKIKCEFIKASELNVMGSKSDLILNICKKIGTNTYITGVGSKNYLDEKSFDQNNIDVKFIKPIVENFQFKNQSINPNYSIIDFLFNFGFKNLNEFLDKNAN